jgi:hypothetical protein
VIYLQQPVTVTKLTFCRLANEKIGWTTVGRGESEMHEVIDLTMKSISLVRTFVA